MRGSSDRRGRGRNFPGNVFSVSRSESARTVPKEPEDGRVHGRVSRPATPRFRDPLLRRPDFTGDGLLANRATHVRCRLRKRSCVSRIRDCALQKLPSRIFATPGSASVHSIDRQGNHRHDASLSRARRRLGRHDRRAVPRRGARHRGPGSPFRGRTHLRRGPWTGHQRHASRRGWNGRRTRSARKRRNAAVRAARLPAGALQSSSSFRTWFPAWRYEAATGMRHPGGSRREGRRACLDGPRRSLASPGPRGGVAHAAFAFDPPRSRPGDVAG